MCMDHMCTCIRTRMHMWVDAGVHACAWVWVCARVCQNADNHFCWGRFLDLANLWGLNPLLFQLFPASTTLPTAAVLNVPASFSLPRWQCTPNVQPDLSGLTTSVTSVAIHRAVWFHYLWGNTHLMFSQICLVSLPQRQYTDLSGLTTSGAIHTQCSARSVWSHRQGPVPPQGFPRSKWRRDGPSPDPGVPSAAPTPSHTPPSVHTETTFCHFYQVLVGSLHLSTIIFYRDPYIWVQLFLTPSPLHKHTQLSLPKSMPTWSWTAHFNAISSATWSLCMCRVIIWRLPWNWIHSCIHAKV